MIRHTHIHLHLRDSFEESKHPRAANGQFGAATRAALKKIDEAPNPKREDPTWGGPSVNISDLGWDLTHARIHGTGEIKPHWGKVGSAKINELVPSQVRVTRHGVRKYLENPNAAAMGEKEGDLPQVHVVNGRQHIVTGHHRLTAAKLRGEEEAPVRFIHFAEQPDRLGRLKQIRSPK